MNKSDKIYEELITALSVQGPAPKDTVRDLVMKLHLAHYNEKLAMVHDFSAHTSQVIRDTADAVVEGLKVAK